MKPYVIGLDIGVASVGWAVLALDGENHPRGILDLGVRIFDAAEHPKTGASLAAPRREARSTRRRLRRHRHRNERIRRVIVAAGLLTQRELDELFVGKLEDIYSLRVRALDEPVSAKSFARILIHLSQRRGFRSNRKTPSDAEDGKLLEAVNVNKQRMASGDYRTVGEMLLKDPAFAETKRNKGGEYITTVTRDMVEEEVRRLFAAQREYGASFATKELEDAYLAILLSQRSFDDGPGGNSPYGGDQIANMVGKCTLDRTNPRAARATYSFEYFSLLEKINHIRLIRGGQSEPLSEAQRRTLIELAHRVENLSFARIRKELLLDPETRFNLVRYDPNKSPEDVEKATKLVQLKAYHRMRAAFEKASKGSFALVSAEQRDAIGTALSLYKTSEKIRARLLESGVPEEWFDTVESIGSFSKFGHLSINSCKALIPWLEKGMNYNEACAAAGYDFKAHPSQEKTMFLTVTEDTYADLTSPVVRRAVSQSIKVLNAIIRKQGHSPTLVNIELSRELAKDLNERRKDERTMAENRAANEKLMEQIRTEFGRTAATGQDLIKLKLYKEQDGICAYSLRPISIERLFEPGYAEIDHIVPYSISFDDSMKNKVLVLAKENRDKGNRLPLEYLSGKRREDFIVWTNNTVRNTRKKQLLLKEHITPDDESSFKERNLQDTKTAARFFLNLLQDHLLMDPTPVGKKQITAVNGVITSYLRKRWGIVKNREDGDIHHAVDAVVIACATDAMIQEITRYSALREARYMQRPDGSYAVDAATGEVLERFPYPWPEFRRELEARTANDPARVLADMRIPFYWEDDAPEGRPIFVSRMPRRKVTGAAHKDTVKSARALEQGVVVTKQPLTSLKLDKLGEIDRYYDPSSDRLLYEALKARLIAFGGDGKKAFAEPFHKPKSDGTPGPLVKKVKLTEPTTLNVPVQGGTAVADNDSMVRIDVFHVEGDGYYFVPIYVADTLKAELPDRACVANKPYAEWKPMRDEDFVFSLYPNDLIRVTHRKAMTLSITNKGSTLPESKSTKSELLYYRGADISVGAISCVTHDSAYFIRGIGIKTLEKLEKYTVDVLGEYHPVKHETRQSFSGRRD